MKKKSLFFLLPGAFLLFLSFPKALTAEQKYTIENIEEEKNLLENEHNRQWVTSPVMNKPYQPIMSLFHQRMEKRTRGYHSMKEDARFFLPEMGERINAQTKNPSHRAPYKTRIRENNTFVRASADTWKIETIDDPKYFTNLSSRTIAVDANDNLHVAYGGDHLYYAYDDGSTWNYETVDVSPNVGSNASIALDSSGMVHISYSGDGTFNYATNASGTWVTTTVDKSVAVSGNTSMAIAVDSMGKVHICYRYWDAVDLEVTVNIKYATNASGAWSTTIVNSAVVNDPSVYSSVAVSMAIDSLGKVHISYYDGTNIELNYITNVSGTWTTTTVDSNSGYKNSIAIDSGDKVHISYYDFANVNDGWVFEGINLKYATNASGTWVTTTVDSEFAVGFDNSIAIDSLDKVHISYATFANALKYATNASGTWTTATVDSEIAGSNGNAFLATSIALDSDNNAHIIDYHWDNGDLKYVTNASGSWTTTTVDSSGDIGSDTSIAIDSVDKVHISYYDHTKSDLRYATNASGTWTTTTVDSSGDIRSDTSIAIDSVDKVHISYYDLTNKDLKYATNASGTWTTTTVDSSGDVGSLSSIAIDSVDKIHISYHDLTNKDLKYVSNASGTWTTTTVDSSGDVGSDNSIAIDSGDKVHISYYDLTKSDLKYATNASGMWVIKTVDKRRSVGLDTSIGIDSKDKVHISYYDLTNKDLKYATNASGTWAIKTVDRSGSVGWDTSIGIDFRDKVHISYYDWTKHYLKYATNAAGKWTKTMVDYAGIDPSIAIDSEDKVHIGYQGDGVLKYATNSFCMPDSMALSEDKITLTKGENKDIIVTLTDTGDCPTDGIMVKAKIKKRRGKKIVAVSPSSNLTDSNGQAVFTIIAQKKARKTKVMFLSDKLKARLKIEVVK